MFTTSKIKKVGDLNPTIVFPPRDSKALRHCQCGTGIEASPSHAVAVSGTPMQWKSMDQHKDVGPNICGGLCMLFAGQGGLGSLLNSTHLHMLSLNTITTRKSITCSFSKYPVISFCQDIIKCRYHV